MPDNIDDGLIGRTVLDAAGGTIGVLTALYTDADSGQTTFAGVTALRRGRRRTMFVPLDDAAVAEGTVTVRCGGRLARRAPAVQAGRGLPAEDEPGLFAHYDMPYAPANISSRRLLAAE